MHRIHIGSDLDPALEEEVHVLGVGRGGAGDVVPGGGHRAIVEDGEDSLSQARVRKAPLLCHQFAAIADDLFFEKGCNFHERSFIRRMKAEG